MTACTSYTILIFIMGIIYMLLTKKHVGNIYGNMTLIYINVRHISAWAGLGKRRNI